MKRSAQSTANQPGNHPPQNEPQSGATIHRVSFNDKMDQWRSHHKRVAAESLKRLVQNPAGSLLTILVTALALALPFSLGLIAKNLHHFNEQWDGALSVSVYLNEATSIQDGQAIKNQWSQRPDIQSARYISPDQGLASISEYSDAQQWVKELGENPLPAVIVLVPNNQTEAGVNELARSIRQHPAVANIQLDNEWVQRLNGFYELFNVLFWVLTIALVSTALMVITNTLRLDVENRKEEIFVVRLVGGTDTFVRRPFLYMGFWYGLYGSLLALGILISASVFVTEAIEYLSQLYQSSWTLLGPDWLDIGNLLICGTAIGLAGSWIAVNKHLKNEQGEEIPQY